MCATSCLSAQNTGFMGKRFLFNMEVKFSPAWVLPNFSENPNFQGKWYSFDYTLSPNVEFILHKKGTLGLVYHYLGTRYRTQIMDTGYVEDDWWGNNVTYKIENLKAHGFGIFYKAYFGEARAPAGLYFKTQFDGFFFKCPNEERTGTMSDQLFGTKIEFGNDFLFFNRLHLSTGFSLGITFGGFVGDGLFSHLAGGFGIVPPNLDARSKILGTYWLGFTVGIGFLAF